jgi:hypothetical protein
MLRTNKIEMNAIEIVARRPKREFDSFDVDDHAPIWQPIPVRGVGAFASC